MRIYSVDYVVKAGSQREKKTKESYSRAIMCSDFKNKTIYLLFYTSEISLLLFCFVRLLAA